MTHTPYATDPEHVAGIRLALLAALVQGDLAGAYRLALELLDDGVPFESIVADVLAPVQGEVGRRWAEGDLSIADEHAATAVVEDLVTMLAGGLQVEDGPTVVVACAEGDEHSLPGRIATVALGLHGVRATFLGPSLPAAELGRFVSTHRPDAVALSCSVVAAVPALARSIAAVHDAGVPVVVGGRALGGDDRRAAALGADAWAAQPSDAAEAIERWHHGAVDLARPTRTPPDECARLASRRAILVARAFGELAAVRPDLEGVAPELLERLVAELSMLLRVTEAALLLDDDAVLDEHVAWLVRVFAAHGVPDDVLGPALDALIVAAGDDLPGCVARWERAAALTRGVG